MEDGISLLLNILYNIYPFGHVILYGVRCSSTLFLRERDKNRKERDKVEASKKGRVT